MGKEEVLSFTKIVNMLLGKPVAMILALLHIQPENPLFAMNSGQFC